MTTSTLLKYCTKCKENKDATEFGKNARAKDKLQAYCTTCRKQQYHQDREKDPEKYYLKSKQWRDKNKEHKAKADRLWAQNNREKSREIKARWKKVHKEQNNAIGVAYREKNKDKLKERNKKYREANREKCNLKEARRRTRKFNNGVFEVSDKEVKALLKKLCFYCGNPSKHIDHIVPISRGGRHSIGNLVQSCAHCNHTKHSKFIVEWKRGKK